MYVKPFGYVAAGSVQEAADALRRFGPGAKVLAGGQSLIPMINVGLVQPEILVDVSAVPGLGEVSRDNGTLSIGALVRHRTLEASEVVRRAHPLLAAAVRHVASPRVRNRGTAGGSIAHNDPTAEVPLVMAVAEAEYDLSNGAASRTVAATDFALTYFTTRLAPDEVLTGIRVPALPDGWGWGFHEVSRRAGDFALVAAAAVAVCRDGAIEQVRLGLSGVSERAVRCRAFEAAASGADVDAVASLAGAIDEDISPSGDAAVSAEYRVRLARALGMRAVLDACRRSTEAARW
jgi:aerobic carbon-monoxide dehydrogenase medium subunit